MSANDSSWRERHGATIFGGILIGMLIFIITFEMAC